MTRLLAFPTKYTQIKVEGVRYVPDSDGNVQVFKAHHVAELVRMGARDLASVRSLAPRSAARAAPAPDIAPAAPPAPEAPSAAPVVAPPDDATKAELVKWLQEHGVAVSPYITKANLWLMVKELVAEK